MEACFDTKMILKMSFPENEVDFYRRTAYDNSS